MNSRLFRFPAGVPAGLAKALPELEGRAVRVRFRPGLASVRGRAVHAGSLLRQRVMVLDQALLESPAELRRIFFHEAFHFVWLRLGNQARRSWEAALAGEMRQRVAGELGWSAEWRKLALAPSDRTGRSRRWREYACESFCDSAAWLLCGGGRHEEFTLPGPWRAARRRWLETLIRRRIPI